MVALSAILWFAILRSGGVGHDDQNSYLFAPGVVVLAATLWRSGARTPLSRCSYLLPLISACAVFQILPLPTSWVVTLSPARAEGLSGLAGLGLTCSYATLSGFPVDTRD